MNLEDMDPDTFSLHEEESVYLCAECETELSGEGTDSFYCCKCDEYFRPEKIYAMNKMDEPEDRYERYA